MRPGPGGPAAGAAVYVVTDPGVPVFGAKGCSVHVQEVLRELVRRHRSVHLVVTRLGGDPPPDLAGVLVHRIPRPVGADLVEREAAQRRADADAGHVVAVLCARRPVSLVYVRYALWSAAPLEAAREAGVRTVLEINAPLPVEAARHRGLQGVDEAVAMTRRALAATDAPFAVAGPVAAWAGELDPRGRRVRVVPNGVDVSRFVPAPRPVPDRLTVVFSGTFRPWHGTTLLADALGIVRARTARGPDRPGLELLLLGDGPELAPTVARARELGVPVTAAGRVAPDEVPGRLAGADLAAAPYPAGSHYFSPLKVAEYLAAGLPTVAAAIADLPDLVADGTEALLVPPGDVDALADALTRLVVDPALRARLAVGARAAAVERMSWSATVDATVALLEEVA